MKGFPLIYNIEADKLVMDSKKMHGAQTTGNQDILYPLRGIVEI